MKKQYMLDGTKMYSRKETHAYIKDVLEFPAYYGNNLDALYDCLTEIEANITIANAMVMKENLGEYGDKLLQVFADAQEENIMLEIHLL